MTNMRYTLILLALVFSTARAFVVPTSPTTTPSALSAAKTKVVVVGGGWAGFSAADAIGGAGDDVEVELLDASPRGAGGLASGWRSERGRSVEAGLHGFWREYRNTYAAIERMGLSADEILTDYTPSLLISESGKVALAPVLGEAGETMDQSQILAELADIKPQDLLKPETILAKFSSLLPPPLDVALLSEFNPDNPLTLLDRASAIGLLGAWADFEQEGEESWARYDSISAETLFRSTAGVSPAIYRELVSPLLHVLPMTPGYDCSAAAALSCFHVFALQSKGAFDVRWCRGTISEKIFNPWAKKLQERGNTKIRGSAKVTAMEEAGGRKYTLTLNDSERIECDAVVMAVGGTAMKRLLPTCPPLAGVPGASEWNKFRGVTCVAVRLFLKPTVSDEGTLALPPSLAKAMEDSPVVVCGANVGAIPELVETGFCIYDLQRIQDEFKDRPADADDPYVAIEVDFFRADGFVDLNDDEMGALTVRAVCAALEVDAAGLELLDASVVRARDAVSHFCVGSAGWSPKLKLGEGLYCCGDWIDRSGHASWSTEKAVVTARQAASKLSDDFGLKCDTDIIPAAKDTLPLETLRKGARIVRRFVPQNTIPLAPWILADRIQGSSSLRR